MITRHSLAHELLALNLISRSAIVDGGFRVQEQLGRNRVYAVSVNAQPRFLVKQSTPLGTARMRKTITREAKCLEFAQADEGLRPHLPDLVHIDHQHQFMVQEFVQGKQFADLRGAPVPERIELARQFGYTLAVIHRRMRPLFDDADDHENTIRPAWILSPHRIWTARQLQKHSPLIAFAAVLQQFPEVEKALDATSELWQRNAWIHHDVKMTNCLLAENAAGNAKVVFVDWELSRLGDTAWDLAGMVHSVVGDAIIQQGKRQSLEERTDGDDGRSLAAATKMTSAMCDAYLQEAGIEASERPTFLHRCLVYTGARLIQLASESQSTTRRMTSYGLLLLQAGLNLMQSPQDFAEMVGLEANR